MHHEFIAAKRRRSLAGGENPRFRNKQNHQAPQGRHSNSAAVSSVALSGLSIHFRELSGGFRPRLNSSATSWLTKSATLLGLARRVSVPVINPLLLFIVSWLFLLTERAFTADSPNDTERATVKATLAY